MIHSPIVHYEIVQMRQREIEAKASRYWQLELDKIGQPRLSQKHNLAWTATGLILATLFIWVQIL